MTPIGKRRHDPSTTADFPEAKNNVRRGSAQQMLAVFLLALGIASICAGLYSLIQAFDALDIPMAFKVWLSRAVAAMVIGWICLHIGGKRVETL
ncbi:hypothetical protein [Burkholderia sp. YIM B11467]